MSLLEELSAQPVRPTYAETLKPFSRPVIAKRLNISTGYLANILTGTLRPGAELNKKLCELAALVDAERSKGTR